MATVTRAQLEEAFVDADWPMTKDQVVAYAERVGDDEVVRAVSGLPLGDYDRFEDVLAGIDTPDTAN